MNVAKQTLLSMSSSKLALSVARGGASIFSSTGSGTALLTSMALDSASSLSGGDEESISVDSFNLTPQGKAASLMAVSLALHYLGYSLARPVTVALFTSASTGYAGQVGAFPFAMVFVSPLSLVLLFGYGRSLEQYGAHGTMVRTTLFCSLVMILAAILLASFQHWNVMIGTLPAVKFVSFPLFVFREAYVQLLTSQCWGFLASTLTPTQSAQWFAPIAGLTSITGALSGFSVTTLVQQVGLSGALMAAGVTLLVSLVFSSRAYDTARRHGFAPEDTLLHDSQQHSQTKTDGFIHKAINVFERVPVLRLLFVEILACQGLATILNICFVSTLSIAIPDDTDRAGYVGAFFSAINVCTMILQFGLLPKLVSVLGAQNLWRIMPLVTFVFTTFQATCSNPTLAVVSASFMALKVTEYSVRRMLDEMIYVPLDFESRFLGKEVISIFGHRFGKSLISLGLSALTSVVGNMDSKQTSILSSVASLLWLRAAWDLSDQVPSSEDAEEAYAATRKPKSGWLDMFW